MDVLKIYSSRVYQGNINSLTLLFIHLIEPVVDAPTEPIGKKSDDISGVTTALSLSKFQETVYNEEIKIKMKDTKCSKSTTTSLYNVV